MAIFSSSDPHSESRNNTTRFQQLCSSGCYPIPTRTIKSSALSLIVVFLTLTLLQISPAVDSTFAAPSPSATATQLSYVGYQPPAHSVTFTAAVSSCAATGTVTFLDGAAQLAQVPLDPSSFTAQLVTSTLAAGSHSFSAQYSGDANCAPSTGTLTASLDPSNPMSIKVTPTTQALLLGGNTQQYAALGTYSDGSSVDVTNFVGWTSSNPAVATISSSGLASTSANAGNTAITATYGANGTASSPVTLQVKTPGASVQFLGGGSSAMFLELGQAAQSSPVTNTPCVWTHSSRFNDVGARDNRPAAFPPSLPVDEFGDIWVTWSPGSGTCAAPAGNFDIYAYTSLDSVLGVRCYFEVDDDSGNTGCVEIMNVAVGTAGENKLCNLSGACVFGPDTPIPQAIINSLNQKHWFAAGTDILPQDAKFSLLRMFTPCGSPIYRQPFDQGLRETYGLGYRGTIPGIGLPVLSHFSNDSFHTLDFNYEGHDPIKTGLPVPGYTITTLGAKPIIVAVTPAGGTGIGAATDIPGFTLALFTGGVLGRTTDLLGPTDGLPVTTLISEPFSGPYNVMEYSIPNTSQFHISQDVDNCDGKGGVYSNAMGLQSANGQILSFRVRALGTNEMITQLQAGTSTDQRLGYFYWSAANASTFTASNGKYLTVNGVDPLQDTYTDGVLPGVDSAHPLSNVTFKWLNMGDYPIWSVLRIVSKSPTPVGVSNLISAARGLNVTQHNFISTPNLQVWHSHYYLPATGDSVSALGNTIDTPGDLCPIPGALPEIGGDLGGANTLKQANRDFCTDFGNINGLLNKAN